MLTYMFHFEQKLLSANKNFRQWIFIVYSRGARFFLEELTKSNFNLESKG